MKLLVISMLIFLNGCANSGYDPHFITQEEISPVVQKEESQIK